MEQKKPFNSIAKLVVGTVAALSFFLFSANALATSIQVSTLPPTSVTATSMTFNGNFAGATSGTVQVHFAYGTTPAMGSYTAYQNFTSTGSSFSQSMTGLSSGTTYYYRAEGMAFGGPGFGSTIAATTTSYQSATVQTLPIANSTSDITGTTALLQGFFNSNGSTTSTYFEYANNASFIGAYTTTLVAQSGTAGPFSATATGLSPNTTYYYRAKATNGGGTVTATTAVSFTTTSGGGGGGNTCTINNFSVNPTSISSGSTTTVTWSTSNCANVNVTGGGISSNQLSGNISSTTLYGTTTFYITADNQSNQATVTVGGNNNNTTCQISSFYASPSWINAGSSTTLYWTGSNCNYVTITGPGLSGGSYYGGTATTGAVYTSGTYYLTGYGSNGGTTSANTTINLNTVVVNGGGNNGGGNYYGNQCQITSFYASPSQVSAGNATQLYWNTQNCTSVSVTGGSLSSYGTQNLSGSTLTGAIYGTTTYMITAYGYNSGTVTQQLTVSSIPTTIFNGGGNVTPVPVYSQPTTIIRYITAGGTPTTTTNGSAIVLGSTVSGNMNGSYVSSGNNLAGLALWGGNIIPTSMIGILLVILLIMAIVVIARNISKPDTHQPQGHH